MSFPTVIGTPGTKSGATTAEYAAIPAGVAAGDYLVVAMLRLTSTVAPTLDPKWTEVQAVGANSRHMRIGYCVADGTETGDVLFSTIATTDQYYSVCHCLRGCSGIEASVITLLAASLNPDIAAFSPAGGSKDYLWLPTLMGPGAAQATAAPAGYSGLVEATNGTQMGVVMSRRTATAATEDPGPYTLTASIGVHCTLIAVAGIAAVAAAARSFGMVT